MTGIGIIFAIAYLISLRWGRRGVITVAIFAAPYFDSAAINAGTIAISPFYLGMVILAVLSMASVASGAKRLGRTSVLGVFWLYSMLVTISSPLIFAGIDVIAAGQTLESQWGAPSALTFSVSNFAQATYLTLNVILVSSFASMRKMSSLPLTLSLGTGILVSLSAWVTGAVGLDWPVDFFWNSVRGMYTNETIRLSAQFAEPSHLGAFSTISVLYFLALSFTSRSFLRAACALAFAAVSIFVFSLSAAATAFGGAAVALAVLGVVAVALLIVRIYRSRRTVRVPMPLFMLIGLVGPGLLLLGVPWAIRALTQLVGSKIDTESAVVRSYVDAHSLHVLVDTMFLGAGLGSNRTSSLGTLLLGTVGVVGTLLFIIVLWRALWRGLGRRSSIAVACGLAGYTGAAFVSFADMSNPVGWILLAYAYLGSGVTSPSKSDELDAADPVSQPEIEDSGSHETLGVTTDNAARESGMDRGEER